MPEILYHYCSINTLDLILKNQKIRFSSLSTVDDMEESLTAEDSNLGKVCFVSCWTDQKQDKVEMWQGYTKEGKGVRIGLPKDFFHQSSSEDERLTRHQYILEEYDISINPPYSPVLTPVTYTKDDSLIELSVLEETVEHCNDCGNESRSLNLNTSFLGKFKRNIWAYQAEWRYTLFAIPYQYYRNHEEGKYLKGSLQDRFSLIRSDLINVKFKSNFIDYPFDKSNFKDLEILTSPLNTEKENQEVEKIAKKYIEEKHISIKKSKLKIRR